MTNNLVLFKASFLKSFWLLKRYLFNTIMMSLGMFIIFALLFFGGSAVAPTVVNDSKSGIIIGFFLWSMAIRAYGSTSNDITKEAEWGTLEQLHLTPYGIGRVMLTNTFANVLLSFIIGGGILLLMLLSTGTTLQIDVLTVVPLVVLTILPVVGFGLVFGGLALLYKHVDSAASLMQMVFVVFLGAPLGASPVVKLLPMALGFSMLQEAMTSGTRLWQFPTSELLILVGTTVLYLGGGYLVFQVLQRRARKEGVLGHY